MKKDEIFFAEKGLTSTHASYLANNAKELYQKLESDMNNIRFYDTTVGLIGSIQETMLSSGVDKNFINSIEFTLHRVAQLKSLIAWIRESLKAKDNLIAEAKNWSVEAICEQYNIEYPVCPERYKRLTADDIIASWNIKQRNRYYYLETLCSTIGAYVHPNGAMNVQRDKLFDIISNPNSTTGSGRDTVIYYHKPTCSTEEVDKVFFELQNKYREYQAELNSMKHEIELAIQQDDREKTALESKEAQEFASRINVINAQCAEIRKEAVAKAQALKITIPDSLKSVYDEVSALGKK